MKSKSAKKCVRGGVSGLHGLSVKVGVMSKVLDGVVAHINGHRYDLSKHVSNELKWRRAVREKVDRLRLDLDTDVRVTLDRLHFFNREIAELKASVAGTDYLVAGAIRGFAIIESRIAKRNEQFIRGLSFWKLIKFCKKEASNG